MFIDLNRTTRADMFVKNHIDVMDTQLTLAFSKVVKRHADDIENVDNVKCDAPIKVHKSTNVDIVSKKNPTKAKTMPNIDRNRNSILNPRMRGHVDQQVPLLPNGSELQRGKTSIVLTHACCSNSITSVYAAAYIDNSKMRSRIDNSSSKFAAYIKLIFQQKTINSKIEFARYEYLREIFPDKKAIKETKNLVLFKCDVAIGGLFSSKCLNSADILSSRRRMEKCSNCRYESHTESPFVNYSIESFDFKNVQNSIVSERNRVCNRCMRKTVTIEDEFHEVVTIDCESLNLQNNQRTTINDIQSQIDLNGAEYELFAAIEYDPELKHFIPHIKRNSNDWETYDDLHRTKSNTNIQEEMFIFMLFYKKKSNGMCLLT